MPGSKQERFRIQSIGAESLDENILGTIPVVSVTLKQNYGGRLIHAFNKFLRPGIVYLAIKDAQLAVLGPNVAFDLLLGRKYAKMLSDGKISEANEYRGNFLKKYIEKSRSQNDAKSTGLVDWIIDDISLLRENLIKGFVLAAERAKVLKDC
jgi:acetyl-CoA carboxylase carboxyltransferase component